MSEATPRYGADQTSPPTEDRMLKWFAYDHDHLPSDLQRVSRLFHTAAHDLVAMVKPGPERTVALRKLLEGKDAAVRQAIEDRT
jgi:hypothetical protein